MLWLKMASSSWLFGPCFNHFFFVFCSRLGQFACQLCSCWWEDSNECYGSKWQAHPGYLDLFNHFFFVFCSRLGQFACQLCSCWWEASDECYGSKWQAHPGYLDLASIISSLSFALGSSNSRVNSAPIGGKSQMNAMAQNGKLILVIWTFSIISSLSFALGSANLRVNSAPVGGKPQMNAMAQNGKLILVIWTLLQSFLLCLLL